MKCSDIAKAVILAKEFKLIKTCGVFWKKYYFDDDKNAFEKKIRQEIEPQLYEKALNELENQLYGSDDIIICAYDDEFPVFNSFVRDTEKPFLLYCKGDISLLKNIDNNIAVIGVLNPEDSIVEREVRVVKSLVDNNQIIVSGLAKGCDTVAHKTCVENGGKTIAILPTPINRISPAENMDLADKIVETGGLLVSEYIKQPLNRYDGIKRYIERDRLQAMFSKAVILIASYREGEGDSGSKYAMNSALKYRKKRYVMFNKDENNSQFGLNYDLLKNNRDVKIITQNEILKLIEFNDKIEPQQVKLF